VLDIEVKTDVLAVHGFQMVELPDNQKGPFWMAGLGSSAGGGLVATMSTQDGRVLGVSKGNWRKFGIRQLAGGWERGVGLCPLTIRRKKTRGYGTQSCMQVVT